jgi:hypothetical protein
MDLAYWHDISHPVLLHFRGNARISEAAWVIDLAESRVYALTSKNFGFNTDLS